MSPLMTLVSIPCSYNNVLTSKGNLHMKGSFVGRKGISTTELYCGISVAMVEIIVFRRVGFCDMKMGRFHCSDA